MSEKSHPQLSRAAYVALSPQDRADARRRGQLRDLLAGKPTDPTPTDAEPETPPAAPSLDGAGRIGSPIDGPSAQIATREEYAALSPEERRAARENGRLNQLLNIQGA